MTQAELELKVSELINSQLAEFWRINPDHRVLLNSPDAVADMAEQFCNWAGSKCYDLANKLAEGDEE